MAPRFVLSVAKFTCSQFGLAHVGLAITLDCLCSWYEVCIGDSVSIHGAGTALSMCAAASVRLASIV